VTLTATAQGQSVFAGMTNAACSANTCSVVMTQARNVVANFTATGTFLLTVDAESDFGTVTSNPPGIDCASSTIGHICTFAFPTGTSVQLTAKAATGYVLNRWSGDCVGSAVTCTVLMTQARSVTAFFSQTFPPVLSGFSASLLGVAHPNCAASNGGSLYQVRVNYADQYGTVAMNTSSVSLTWQGSLITTWTDSWTGTPFNGTVTLNACVVFGTATSGTFIVLVRNVSPPPGYSLISGSVSKPNGAK